MNELPQQDLAHPLPDLGVIDINVVKGSGGSDLIIVVASPLAGDEYSLRRLLRKVEVYLAFLHSDEFIAESGFASPDNTRIVARLHPHCHPLAVELLEKNKQWVRNNDATLVIEPLDSPPSEPIL
jgi:hypothetical protein